MIWYPIHDSVVARERVAAGQFAKCRQHAASIEAIKFCDNDYARDLEDAREIRWEQHPLWHPFWLGLLVLLLPPFAIFGMIWIITRSSFSSAGTPSKQAVPSR